MAPMLQLDLNSVTIDSSLTQRVPYALSRYYLALPIGQDNGSVSVAMAYPDNVKARQVLSHLLQAQVVPVFTPAEALLPILETIYNPENPVSHAILAWHEQPEWESAVAAASAMLGETFRTYVTSCSSTELNLNEVLQLAATDHYELIVLPLPMRSTLLNVLNQAATSLYFVRGEKKKIRHILAVIRGFASDEHALNWLAPFALQQQADVTLMPLANGYGMELNQYHRPDSRTGQHMARCLQRLQDEKVSVNLKFRQGDPIQQVLEEVKGKAYDLLVLAAEAEGDFVNQVILAVDQSHAHHDCPIFVLKPPELPQQPPISF